MGGVLAQDPLSREPIYQQLNRILRELIGGDFQIGDQFLTERKICQQYQVSRATANKALSNLVSEGLLEFKKGIGTFVRYKRQTLQQRHRMIKTRLPGFTLRFAVEEDIPLILAFIKELAAYEKLSHLVTATEADLQRTLFGDPQYAEVVLGEFEGKAAGFMLFFPNYSTFLGRPGIYLEDLYIKPQKRQRGFGRIMLAFLADLAVRRGCGRLEWAVLDWNEPAIRFYLSLGADSLKEWVGNRVTGEALHQLAGQFSVLPTRF
jgi:DNA-binding transcriptional regulator YhcF (GntR family)